MNRMLSVIVCLIVFVVFITAGCNEQEKTVTNALDYGPDIESIVVTNGYTPRAINVTGGYKAWMKVKRLDADCVVTFYNSDGSYYLTEQHHEIYPWSNSVKISAVEPLGVFTWQLSDGNFSILKGIERVGLLPVTVCDRAIAQAILNITTAPVRFMDTSAEFTEGPRPVRVQGMWYYPIEQTTNVGADWSKAVFYQSKDNSLVDMIWFVGVDAKKSLVVRGYDYRDAVGKDVLTPDKIEIFKTDAGGKLGERIVKIDYN